MCFEGLPGPFAPRASFLQLRLAPSHVDTHLRTHSSGGPPPLAVVPRPRASTFGVRLTSPIGLSIHSRGSHLAHTSITFPSSPPSFIFALPFLFSLFLFFSLFPPPPYLSSSSFYSSSSLVYSLLDREYREYRTDALASTNYWLDLRARAFTRPRSLAPAPVRCGSAADSVPRGAEAPASLRRRIR